MRRLLSPIAATVTLLGLAAAALAQDPQFGPPLDVDFAKRLWNAMEAARMVGRTR